MGGYSPNDTFSETDWWGWKKLAEVAAENSAAPYGPHKETTSSGSRYIWWCLCHSFSSVYLCSFLLYVLSISRNSFIQTDQETKSWGTHFESSTQYSGRHDLFASIIPRVVYLSLQWESQVHNLWPGVKFFLGKLISYHDQILVFHILPRPNFLSSK